MSDQNEDSYISAECFRAYVNAEIKVPNTLIAVGPYVGKAALTTLQTAHDFETALKRFANTFTFSDSQVTSVVRTCSLIHRRFGIPVLPDAPDLGAVAGIRIFELQRFEVVYMEGVKNILESILRLHGKRGTVGQPRGTQVAELLGHPDRMAATVAAFAAAEIAINSVESTQRSEAFKEKFNFTKSGEKPRAMAPADKDGIQAEVMPLIAAAVTQTLADCNQKISHEQTDDFVRVVTSPELHQQAA